MYISQGVLTVNEKLSHQHKRWSNKAQTCMCFQTKPQVPCTLDVLSTDCNKSASSCLSSCFTPLAITSNHLSPTNGATVSLYYVTGSFTGTKHDGQGIYCL